MAKEELLQQVESDKFFEITEQGDLMAIPPEKSILIKSGDQILLFKTIEKIKDRGKYIVFVKNFEQYDDIIGEILKKNFKIILSGNLDEYPDKKNLLKRDWQSKIIFQPQSIDFGIQIPNLKKYESYLISNTKVNGVLRLHREV